MRLLSLLFLLALCGQVVGQRVVWERRLKLFDDDQLTDVIQSRPGIILSSGTRYYYGYFDGINTVYKDICINFTSTSGDTLFTESTGLYGDNPRICQAADGSVFLAVFAIDSSSVMRQLWIARFTADGHRLWRRKIDNQGMRPPFPTRILCPDGVNLWISGYAGSPSGSGNQFDMYVARLDTSGLIYFQKHYNDNPWTLGNHIDPTPRGTYLASGTAGSRIWAVEIDSLGNEIRRATFYHTPSNIIFDETAAVKQGPNDTYVVSGTTQGSPRKFYLGLHNGWAGNRIWGGERQGFVLPSNINDDGTMVVYNSFSGTNRFTKLDADSQVVWENVLPPPAPNTGIVISALSYNPDSSVIGVGYVIDNSTPARNDFYLARISNVGVPYDPAHPVATKPHLPSTIPKPYPNPCTTAIRFSSLTAQARLELYDVQGRQALSQSIQSRQAVDVSALPSGLYSYRLVSGSKVFVGRVVK